MLSHPKEEVFDWTYESCGDFDTLDTFIWKANPFFYTKTYPFTDGSNESSLSSGVKGESIKFHSFERAQSLGIFVKVDVFKALKQPSAITVDYPAQGRENNLATIVPARLYDYFAYLSRSSKLTDEAKAAPGITLLARQCSFPEPCIQSLYATSLAYDLYSELSGGTIPVALIKSQKPLNEARWFKWAESKLEVRETDFERSAHPILSCVTSRPLSRRAAFACLVHLETGKVDTPEENYQNVFAISVDNSIFVPSSLLTDPADDLPEWSLQRIPGNIGHSGISLIVGVKTPQIREPSDDYSIVQHVLYDFHRVDNYKSTSLHLSFTGWSRPLHMEDETLTTARNIDHTISYLESVVSVRDRGRLVADLDLLSIKTMAIPRSKLDPCTNAAHQFSRNLRGSYVSIDDWEELLDPPLESHGIFRARNNWAARLAAVSILLAQKRFHEVSVIGKQFCLVCWEQKYRRFPNGGERALLID